MPRSGADARRRLYEAAIELFRKRGYDATTTAEIAASAGVTERTFFRHFPDKREVLFDGEQVLREALSRAVADAPDDLNPIGVLLWAFRRVAPMFEANRSFTEPLQKVVAQTPALQERVLSKTAGLVSALSEALRRRGVGVEVSTLAAQVGMAAFSYAARAWSEDPTRMLDSHLARAFDELNKLSSATIV